MSYREKPNIEVFYIKIPNYICLHLLAYFKRRANFQKIKKTNNNTTHLQTTTVSYYILIEKSPLHFKS